MAQEIRALIEYLRQGRFDEIGRDRGEDSETGAPYVDPAEILVQNDWHELAVRWSEWALEEMAAGHADMAAERARGAYRFCLRYQLAGGKPWEGPDAE